MNVKLTYDNGAAILTLDRPEALNALSFQIIEDIGRALDEVAVKEGVRVLLITGAGDRSFCAGADIRELRNRSLSEQKRGSEIGQAVFAKLDTLPVPSIALVNGFAFGGGIELALACSLRIASSNASFGLPEIKLGLIPGYGGTQRLPRLIGESRALDMIMTGRTVKAEEALQIGLVNRVVVTDLVQAGHDYASEFTGYSLPILAFTRRAVQRAHGLCLTEGLQVEAELSTLAYQTDDAEEGMAAFEEKRPPKFRDG